MDAARFARVEEAFHRASERTGEARDQALAEICGGDPALRREVEELLAAAERAAPALDRLPALRFEAEEPVPERIGPYRVLRRLGAGGSSVVYLAEEEGDGFRRQVAVKLLAGVPGAYLGRRFAAETRILAGLEHPGIARFHTAGRAAGGTAYLVLEYVEGSDLLTHCRERRAPLAERLRIFLAVLEAVEAAHRSLVVHRDLKPGNILVSPEGRPKLLDFGIAALLDPSDGVARSETATLLRTFTPAYASPEQLRGERVTTASDVYSLGVVLYELLSGARPHPETGLEEAVARGFRAAGPHAAEPEPPSAAARRRPEAEGAPEPRQLQGDLDAIVGKALRADPAARYGSAAALAEDLRRHLAGLPVLARRPTLRYRADRYLRRHAAAAAALAGAAVLAGSGLAWHVDRLQRERDRAQAAAEQARQEAARAERVVELLSGVFEAASPMDQSGRPVETRELLERGGARVERSLAADPALRAELRTVLGGIWSLLGDQGRAAALLEPAAADLEQRLGPDHRATAQAWSVLASLRYRQGRYREARDLAERALAVQRRELGPRAPAVATTLTRYGASLLGLGEFPAARRAYEEAIAIAREAHGPESAQEGQMLSDLSAVQERLLDWNGAERSAGRAATILARHYGRENSRYAMALANLATVRSSQKRYPEAIALLEEVLRIDRKTFGEASPRETHHRTRLGWSHLRLRHYAAARREFERALAVVIQQNGPDHIDTTWPLRGLAAVEIELGRKAAARRHFERSLAVRRQVHGPVHWEIAMSYEDLAEVADDDQGEEDNRRRALEIYRQVYDKSHPDVARAAAWLGEVVCRRGGAEEGTELLSEAIGLRQKTAGEGDADLAEWRRTLEVCKPGMAAERSNGSGASWPPGGGRSLASAPLFRESGRGGSEAMASSSS